MKYHGHGGENLHRKLLRKLDFFISVFANFEDIKFERSESPHKKIPTFPRLPARPKERGGI